MKRKLSILAGSMLLLELVCRCWLGSVLQQVQGQGFYPYGAGDQLPSRLYSESYLKPYLPYTVRTNALGLRSDMEYPARKAPGSFRIIALGDSMTFGLHVSNPDTWPARLEALLRRGGWPAEVFNTGVVGFTISDEYSLLTEKAIHYQPDLVLVGFYANDILDFAPHMRAFSARPRVQPSVWGKASYALREGMKRSAFFCILFKLKHRLAMHAAQASWTHHPEADGEDLDGPAREKYLGQYLGYLERLVAVTRQEHIPLAYVFIPSCHEINQDRPALAANKAAIEVRLQALGVPYLDLLPALRAAGQPDQLYLLPEEWHMSRYGYQIVAKSVLPFIVEHFLARGDAARKPPSALKGEGK